MWSSVVLSSGLVIFMGCAVAGALLLKKQCHHGPTGYRLLATSDSIISMMIGATLIGFALVQESTIKDSACSQQAILMSIATFLPSFVNSFISMLLMAVECWADSKEEMQSENEVISAPKRKRQKRVTAAMLTQWALPVLTVVILHLMTPENIESHVSRHDTSNDSCILGDMLPMDMKYECTLFTNVVETDKQTDNITFSVVQRIYELIHHSVNDDDKREPVPDHSLDLPQTKEEWQKVLQVPVEAAKRNQRRVKNTGIGDTSLTTCDEICMMSVKRVHVYFLSVILSIYIIPMIGTVMLHHTIKMKNKRNRAKNLESPEDLSITTARNEKECHLSEVKLMAVSNLVLWTPSLIEKLIRKWLCSSPPQWLVAILFTMGHMTSVIRGMINAKPTVIDDALHTNVVVPLKLGTDTSTQETPIQSSDDNSEVLFHKRKLETEHQV